MSDTPFFIVELAIQPGQLEQLRSVAQDLTNAVRSDEPGTVNYEWFVNREHTAAFIFERYASDAAALVHSKTFSDDLVKRSQAFMPTRLNVFGSLGDAMPQHRIQPLLESVPGISIVYHDSIVGLIRERDFTRFG